MHGRETTGQGQTPWGTLLSQAKGEDLPSIESAELRLYELYDLGDSIDLDLARTALTAPAARMRPVVTRGGSIDMPQPPLVVNVERHTVDIGGLILHGYTMARIYDIGILAMCLVLDLPDDMQWDTVLDLLAAVQTLPASLEALFERTMQPLHAALHPAIDRPSETVRTEDYSIFVIRRLGPGTPASLLGRHPTLLRAALGEHRPLSETAATLGTALSYYDDDLILLTWNGAVVVEPDAMAREDAEFLLEFANVQLLAFRSYDDEVERQLARVTPRVARYRRPHWWTLSSTSRFLHEVHALIADSTETSARVENALKVTEDVYWNRVYTAALGVLRVKVWQQGIAEGLGVLREAAALLRDEAAAARATLLEVLVIVLIAVEIVVALLSLRH